MVSVWHDRAARKAVFKAIVRNNNDVVCDAIRSGFPQTAVERRGGTLLHCAANYSVNFVPMLLEHGWDVNARTYDGETPAHAACFSGHLSTVQLLVQAGASLDAIEHSFGCTVAHYSVLDGSKFNKTDRFLQLVELLEWLATRPEVDWCHVSKNKRTVLLELEQNTYLIQECFGLEADQKLLYQQRFKRCIDIVMGAMAAQRAREARCSPLQAAFVGAAGSDSKS
jgi:ankyrin repeat protein